MLGYGPAQVYSYFERPSAPIDSFLPEVQETLIGAEEVRRGREGALDQFAADDAMNEILDEAQNTDTETLTALMSSDPRIMRSPQFPMLQDYVKTRQDLERPSPYSDAVLGPQFAAKIDDPRLRGAFEDDVVRGLNVQQAKANHYKRASEFSAKMKAAEAGFSPAEVEQFRLPDGTFDEAAIQYQATQRKANDPADEMRLRQTRLAFLDRKREANLGELSPVEEAEYNDHGERLGQLFQRMKGIAPTQGQAAAPVGGVAAPAASPVAPVPGMVPTASRIPQTPQGLPLDTPGAASMGARRAMDTRFPMDAPVKKPTATLKTPEQRRQEAARQGVEAKKAFEQAEEQKAVNLAWNAGKNRIAEGLVQLYPDKDDLLGVLKAIYKGEKVPMEDGEAVVTDDAGNIQRTDYAEFVLKQLGVKPSDPLFDEPGNKRWGSQKVRYNEALKALARDELEAQGYDLGDELPIEKPKTTPPAANPEIMSLVDKYTAKK